MAAYIPDKGANVMKSYLILFCLLLMAGGATAQIDPNDNGVGIYADLDGLTNSVKVEAGEALEVYLLLTRPTGEKMLAAWEASLISPDNVSVWGFSYPNPRTLALVDGNNYMAAHEPVPYADANLLMTFIITPLDGHCAQFYIREYTGQHDVTAPRYCDGTWEPMDVDTLIDMVPYPAGSDVACFTINEESLAVTSESLDGVKALYR